MDHTRPKEQPQATDSFRASAGLQQRPKTSPSPGEPLRILHLEDDPTTSRLVQEWLQREGLPVAIDRVDTLPEFAQRLATHSHALILSDFTIPGMDTFEALRLAHQTRPDLPYVFFSGTLGEDAAVEALQQGATDYVLKDRPARLPSAVRRALHEAEARPHPPRSRTTAFHSRTPAPLAPEPAPAPPARRLWTRSSAFRYTAAVLAVLVTWGIRAALDPLLGGLQPFALFLAPVLALGWWAGPGPAALAAVLGWFIGDYFFCYPRYLLLAGAPVEEVTASLVYLTLSAALIPITHHLRRGREQLRESQERFRLFMAHTPTLAWVKDEQGRYVFVNQAYEQRFHVTLAACRGKTDQQLWDADTAARLRQADQQALAAAHPIEVTEETTEADGSVSFWHNTKFTFCDYSGRRFLASLGQDITPRKRAEDALRQSEARFRTIFEQAAIGMGRIDFNNAHWIDANEALCDMLGYTPEFLRATPWPQITHPDDVDLDLIRFRRMAAGELDSYSIEKRFLHQDGHPVWARLTLSLVRDSQGRPDYEIAIIENIDQRKRAEEALAREHAFLEAVLQACPAGVIVADHSGKLIRMNPANERLWGLAPFSASVEEYRDGKGWWADGSARNGRRLQPQDWAMARALRGEVCPGDVVQIEPFGAPGTRRTMLNSAAPVRGEHGEILGAVVAQVDITALKQTEEALRQNEGRLRVFFDSDMFGALYWNTRGEITEANDKFLHMLGYSRQDFQDRPLCWVDITPPEYRSADERSLAEIRAQGAGTPYEKEFVRKDGSRIPVIIGAAAFDERREQGVAFVLDNTQRKRAEAAATELKNKLDAGLLAGEVGIFDWNLVTDRFWGDANFARFFDITLDANSTVGIADLMAVIHPDDRPIVNERIQRTIETGVPYEAEYRIIARDQTRWVVARATAQRDDSGRAVRFPGVLVDITERKRAETLLRAALRNVELERSRLSAVLEALPVGVAIADTEGKVIQFNAALNRIWGSPSVPRSIADYGQWRGRWADTGQPLAAEDWAMARTLRTGQLIPGEVIEIDKFDGSGTATLLNTAAPIRDLEGHIIGGVVAEVDLTEQKRAETLLRQRAEELAATVKARDEALAQLNALLENAPLGFAFFDREHRYARMNEFMARRINGLSIPEHLGRSVSEVLPVNARAVDPLLDAVFASGKSVDNVIVTGETPAAPGERRHWLTAWFPVRTPDQHIPWVGAIVLDITEQQRTELALRQAREELARANADLDRIVRERTARLHDTIADLEGFSYSLVHDLRAPLRAMQGYSALLEEETGSHLQEPERDILRKIKLSAARMDQLVTDSLNYTRILRQELPLGPVHLGELLRGMVETYPNLHPPQADVAVELGPLVVRGNQAALTQVFSNLLGNAVKFVAPGVHPRVRVWAEPVRNESEEAPGPSDTLHVPHVRVFVQDNGIGIPKDARERIFSMFQRLHRSNEYPGTGIGLALVKKSLERTGGHITVESEPGQGSRFIVELLVAESEQPTTANESAA